MRGLAILALVLGLAGATPAGAVTPDEMLKDQGLEARARSLSEDLRCMVCQNESIDDSEAPLAHDIRVLLRERLTAGDSDQAVIDFLVARYGEFILLKPPFNSHTTLLWLTPPGVLVIGAIIAFGLVRRRRKMAPASPLDAAEQKHLDELLAGRD